MATTGVGSSSDSDKQDLGRPALEIRVPVDAEDNSSVEGGEEEDARDRWQTLDDDAFNDVTASIMCGWLQPLSVVQHQVTA